MAAVAVAALLVPAAAHAGNRGAPDAFAGELAQDADDGGVGVAVIGFGPGDAVSDPGAMAVESGGIAPGPALPAEAPALGCMTMAIAYEAGNQPIAGQQAIGQVILNRVRDPRFPKSVCGVVFEGAQRLSGCQFTFACDGALRRRLPDSAWLTARLIAAAVLSGAAPDRVAGATHYHADHVLPRWAANGTPVARIGAHIFYRMPGGNGAPGRPAPPPLTLAASR